MSAATETVPSTTTPEVATVVESTPAVVEEVVAAPVEIAKPVEETTAPAVVEAAVVEEVSFFFLSLLSLQDEGRDGKEERGLLFDLVPDSPSLLSLLSLISIHL